VLKQLLEVHKTQAPEAGGLIDLMIDELLLIHKRTLDPASVPYDFRQVGSPVRYCGHVSFLHDYRQLCVPSEEASLLFV
jgi:hypothetical protein